MNIVQKIEQALCDVDCTNIMFITNMDTKSFRDIIYSIGLKYMYINISGCEDAMQYLLDTISNNMYNSIDGLSSEMKNTYQVFRILNQSDSKYVLQIHPLESIISQKRLLTWLDNIDVNRSFPNVRVVILVKNKSILKDSECLKMFNKRYLLEREHSTISIVSGNRDNGDSSVVPKITAILNTAEKEYVWSSQEDKVYQNLGRRQSVSLIDESFLKSTECMYQLAIAITSENFEEYNFIILMEEGSRLNEMYSAIESFWLEKDANMKMLISGETCPKELEIEKQCVQEIINRFDDIWYAIMSGDAYSINDFEGAFEQFVKNDFNKAISIVNENGGLNPMGISTAPAMVINSGVFQININHGNGGLSVKCENCANSFDVDTDAMERLIEFGYIDPSPVLINSEETLFEEVKKICNEFKDLVENNQVSTLFYRRGRTPDETDWQLLLFSFAKMYAAGSHGDYHISREDNPGPGEIDMHFTMGTIANICLEMKVSSNNGIVHGYQEQLKGYMMAERSKKGIYMIVVQDNQHQADIEKVQKLAEENAAIGMDTREVIIVNGINQLSASQREYMAPQG